MGYIHPIDPYPYRQYVNNVAQVKKVEYRALRETSKMTPVRLQPHEMYERSLKHKLQTALTGKGRFIDYYC